MGGEIKLVRDYGAEILLLLNYVDEQTKKNKARALEW
jgi:hypothetical protein